MEQWGKPLVYYKTKAVLGFPGEESFVFNFCPLKGLCSTTGVTRILGQGAVLAVAPMVRDIMKVRRMLARPSEEITRKTTETVGIVTMGQ